MADKEGFDVGRDLPAFLASVSDRTEHIFQNDMGEGAAEVHAEVVNQSVRMRRLLRDCHDIGTSDREVGFTCSSFCRCVIVFKSSHHSEVCHPRNC